MGTRVLQAGGATAEELRSSIETILREQGLSPAFPAAVEEAAAQAAGSPRLPGRDRTELEFLTIDPVGAMDLEGLRLATIDR